MFQSARTTGVTASSEAEAPHRSPTSQAQDDTGDEDPGARAPENEARRGENRADAGVVVVDDRDRRGGHQRHGDQECGQHDLECGAPRHRTARHGTRGRARRPERTGRRDGIAAMRRRGARGGGGHGDSHSAPSSGRRPVPASISSGGPSPSGAPGAAPRYQRPRTRRSPEPRRRRAPGLGMPPRAPDGFFHHVGIIRPANVLSPASSGPY